MRGGYAASISPDDGGPHKRIFGSLDINGAVGARHCRDERPGENDNRNLEFADCLHLFGYFSSSLQYVWVR